MHLAQVSNCVLPDDLGEVSLIIRLLGDSESACIGPAAKTSTRQATSSENEGEEYDESFVRQVVDSLYASCAWFLSTRCLITLCELGENVLKRILMHIAYLSTGLKKSSRAKHLCEMFGLNQVRVASLREP